MQPSRRVEEVVEKVFIGEETNLRLGIDVPMPEGIYLTGRIITMQPYQQRVIEEKRELDDKKQRLKQFLKGPTFATLGEEEQVRMNQQLCAMDSYSAILGERIAAFKPTDNAVADAAKTGFDTLHTDSGRQPPR